MTPYEKAQELVEAYKCMYHDLGLGKRAIRCAILCCDELIKDNNTAKIAYDEDGAYGDHSDLEFWIDVKKELERL